MATQKHMGANSLVARLTAQVGSREMAVKILRQRGHMEMDSERLTPAGQARDGMTAKERALDRASVRSEHPASAYKYNPATNSATLKRRAKG
jgi:hypothetical protein